MVTMCWTCLSCTDVIQAVHTDIQDLVSRPFFVKVKESVSLTKSGISGNILSIPFSCYKNHMFFSLKYDEWTGSKKNIKPRFDVEPGASFRAPGWLIGDGQVKNTCPVARGKHYGI